MSAVLLGREVQNSPEWDALRANGLGGSEIAAVVGLSPWTSRFALYHRKRGTIPKQDVNPGMAWGTRLEPAICQAWAEQHPEQWVWSAGTFRHSEREWQLANVDKLVGTTGMTLDDCSGLLEAKTAHTYDAFEWGRGPEDIPPYYRCQVVWYMDVLGVNVAHMAVLIGGSDYREYVIPYVADEAEWLREEGRKFWADVVAGNAPPIDGSSATYRAVKAMHPDIESGQEIELDKGLYAAYLATKNTLEEAAESHQQVKNDVLAQMGEAQFAQVGGTSVLRRQSGRGGSVSLYEVKAPEESAA